MKNRWVRLLVGVVVMLLAGVIYAWSILKGPLAEEFGWAGSQLQLCFTLTLCFFCLGGMVSGLLGKRLSIPVRMTAAALMVFGGFFWVGRQNGSLMALYLGYGVLAGTGIGVVYNVVIASTNAWFPDRRGLASGALMMAFGFSTLLVGNVASALFAAEAFGWCGAYTLLGAVIGAVILVSGFLVRPPKPGETPAPSGKRQSSGEDIATRDMLKRPSFWLLFAFFTLLAAVGSTAIGDAKGFLGQIGASASLSTSIVGIVSVCNGLGRLFSGAAFDRIGLRKTQYLTSAVAILAPLAALFAALGKSVPLGIAGLCLCGFSYGFSPTVSAAFAGAFYGQKHYALNFSMLNLVLIPASFASTIGGALNTATGGYAATYIMLAACSVVGLFINIAIRKA